MKWKGIAPTEANQESGMTANLCALNEYWTDN